MPSEGAVGHLPDQGGLAPPLVLIVGPTAVGKSEIAIQLAERMGGEIISADSRLFYRGMDIGTAKPTPAERSQVPHHLIDIANPDETLSLAQFQGLAQAAIADIRRRGGLPFLVGGTGQYVRAVTQGWSPPAVRPDAQLRQILENLASERGKQWLHDRLALLDPLASANIDPRNARRTVRAIEVILSTGRRFSEQRARSASPYRLATIGLSRPQPELYARIDARIDSMFAQGFLREVEGLLANGYLPSLPSMSAIGYPQCVQVLQGRMDVEAARREIRRLTRIFVRRQANWFKPDDPEIHWFRVHAGVAAGIEAHLRTLIDF